MSDIHLTPSQENYLERISRLSQDGPVQVGILATSLGVRLPSVSKAVRNLAELGLVEHRSYGTITLTEAGRTVVEQISRRKECLVELLGDVLGLPKEVRDTEVTRMEHFISDEVLIGLEKLVEFAKSSDAWIKRLQLRIRQVESLQNNELGIVVAGTQVHPGIPVTQENAHN